MKNIGKFCLLRLSKLAKIKQILYLSKISHKWKLILTIFVAINPITAYSLVSNAGVAESYLIRNIGARALGMAGAYTAVVNEPFGLFYNPAGLGFQSADPMIATSYSVLQLGRTQSTLAYGQTFGHLGVGIGFNSFTAGSFTARDVKGNPLGNYSDWQYALNIGGAYTIDFASIGIGIKYLSNTLSGSGTSADGYAVDLGTKFNILNMFSFGLAVRNAAGIMSWNTETSRKETLPFIITSGLAMEFPLNEKTTSTRSGMTGEVETVNHPATRYIMLSLEGRQVQNELNPTLTFGVEAVLHEIIAFRGGIALLGDDNKVLTPFPMTVWGGGISIRPNLDGLPFNSHIDYTISNDYLANNKLSHHISLMLQF